LEIGFRSRRLCHVPRFPLAGFFVSSSQGFRRSSTGGIQWLTISMIWSWFAEKRRSVCRIVSLVWLRLHGHFKHSWHRYLVCAKVGIAFSNAWSKVCTLRPTSPAGRSGTSNRTSPRNTIPGTRSESGPTALRFFIHQEKPRCHP